MPKAVDEDRARRRELLEQKRAARRWTKEQVQQQQQKDAPKAAASTTASTTTTDTSREPCLLFQMKEDCWNYTMGFLSATDMGRLIMTCRSAPRFFAPLDYLATRLQAFPDVQYCPAPTIEQLEMIWKQAAAGGDTGRIRILPRQPAQSAYPDFLAYARFLEQSLHRYLRLKQPHQQPVLLGNGGTMVSVSPEHSLVRSFDGVASWGIGKRGQLGHGKREDEKLPQLIRFGIGYSVKIVQIAAGGGLVRVAHSLLLTEFGRVLSFGTGQYGALGHGYSAAKQLPDIIKPKYIESLHSIVAIAAGELHSAAVNSDGDLFTWGDGFCGQLGHGDKRPQVSPKQVVAGDLADECIAGISCGSRHTVAITEDGDVFTWGLGHFGVLGRTFTPFDYDADAAVVALGSVPDEDGVEVGLPDHDLPEVPPPQRDAAAELLAHFELIANLSLEDSSDQCIPMPVESLKGIRIVSSSAGHRHTLLLDSQGGVYSCGAGIAGCLGHGDTENQMFPMKIKCFDEQQVRIRKISAGVDMSMAISVDGRVYGWGKTDDGRIGLGMSRGQIIWPRQVIIQDPISGANLKAVDVECGYVHSIIVALNGTLHMCGGVGVDGEDDGQGLEASNGELDPAKKGKPYQMENINVWHRVPEPKEDVEPKPTYKKYGKYEIRGRSKMMSGAD
ncbi:hypothetical protein FisN_21Lh039 [Fistulifera solaris]|uniref:Uncharacterized protein n=1 Tax=Fistulifera solaris TaxID=1519565 RepID=A0A1Z5KJU5_FISSO|nr:hypothetical protein FisN_21Lh039 [Fistulifera solaris]|eukprot:GAX26573.1 hypothetical protein FisN_21Lh039 [Fistulifera solaris]